MLVHFNDSLENPTIACREILGARGCANSVPIRVDCHFDESIQLDFHIK